MSGFLHAVGALVFNRTVPLLPRERNQGRAQTGEGPKCTVLAIDDDPSFLCILRPVLREEGFDVLTSTSGAKGLDMLRYGARDIRVVLLDYNMPQLNGAETLEHLRRLRPQVKVLAVTGVDAQLLPPSFREGVDKFLQKPFRSKELVDTINLLLGNGATVPTPNPA